MEDGDQNSHGKCTLVEEISLHLDICPLSEPVTIPRFIFPNFKSLPMIWNCPPLGHLEITLAIVSAWIIVDYGKMVCEIFNYFLGCGCKSAKGFDLGSSKKATL